MTEVQVFRSVHDIGRDTWNACHPGEIEDFDYLAAVESSQMPEFEWRYVVARRAGRAIAAAPGFITDYGLETSLGPTGRQIVMGVRRALPRAFKMRMATLGSPCSEDVGLGFADDPPVAERAAVLSSMLRAFQDDARAAGGRLVAVKDAPTADGGLWENSLKASGFSPAPGMPGAELPIDFDSVDEYLSRLGRGTRRDVRRKLRACAGLRIETREGLGVLAGRVHDLYRETRSRSELQFEDLPLSFFEGLPTRMPGRAFYVLYFLGPELIGANLLLRQGSILLDKYFCMESARGPEHNLWFVSWITNVRYCLGHGLTLYRSGQASYADKLRLGCRLIGARNWFRHLSAPVNCALSLAAPLLADDPVPTRVSA